MNRKALEVVHFHRFSTDHGSFTHIYLALFNLIVLLECITAGYGISTNVSLQMIWSFNNHESFLPQIFSRIWYKPMYIITHMRNLCMSYLTRDHDTSKGKNIKLCFLINVNFYYVCRLYSYVYITCATCIL